MPTSPTRFGTRPSSCIRHGCSELTARAGRPSHHHNCADHPQNREMRTVNYGGRFYTGTLIELHDDDRATILIDAVAGGATTITGREIR